MQRIEADSFMGPRAYFTGFDYRILSRTHNTEDLRKDVERRLKILLLTKTTVVCAASHLTSTFTYDLFKKNPILLNKGLVIPALRRDKIEIAELFEGKATPPDIQKEMISFYSDQIYQAVNWDVQDNSSWFWDSFLKELRDDNSVLRKNLVGLERSSIASIIKQIEEEPSLSREKIDQVTVSLANEQREVFVNFRELIYHISGARVVNCESTLPQENYIDYSLADIETRKVILSDLQIFWKIFLELAFETMNKVMIPIDLMDQLTFDDIYTLREPIENSYFMEDYDEIIKRSVLSINSDDYNSVLYNVNELMQIRDKITQEFSLIMEKELGALLRRKTIENVTVLGKNTISVGLGIAGFFPLLSTLANLGSLILETPAFIVNLRQTFRNKSSLTDYQSYLANKNETLTKSIQMSEISDKSALLEVAKLLTETISSKLNF